MHRLVISGVLVRLFFPVYPIIPVYPINTLFSCSYSHTLEMRYLPFVIFGFGSASIEPDHVGEAREKSDDCVCGLTPTEVTSFVLSNQSMKQIRDKFLTADTVHGRKYGAAIRHSFAQGRPLYTEKDYNNNQQFILGPKIVTTGESILFSARKSNWGWSKLPENYIVKYMKSRPEIVNEYVMMKLAASDDGTRISPEPLYLSPEFPGPRMHTEKCALFDCDQPGLMFRYMIMEKVGPSLMLYSNALPNGRMNPIILMRVLQISTMLLQTLHDNKGIVHNDIHAGNICWKDIVPDETRPDFILIDFGLSRKIFSDGQDELPHRMDVAMRLMSYWSLKDGARPTRRDDVIRLIEAIAMLWRGETYPDFGASREDWVKFKGRGSFFALSPGEPDPLASYIPVVGEDNTEIVTHVLGALANHITHNTGLNIRPDYRLVITVAQYVLNCLNGKLEACSNPPSVIRPDNASLNI